MAKAADFEVVGDEWIMEWDNVTRAEVDGEWAKTPDDPLLDLLAHSDFDGDIWPAQAGPLAGPPGGSAAGDLEGNRAGQSRHLSRGDGDEAVRCRTQSGGG